MRMLLLIPILIWTLIAIDNQAGGSLTPVTSGSAPVIRSLLEDNLMLLRDQGVFVEPHSIAYTYSTFIYERIHLIVPSQFAVDHMVPYCNDDQHEYLRLEKSNMMKTFNALTKDRISEYTSPLIRKERKGRQKRELITVALITAASLVSLGISLYSTMQVREVATQTKLAAEEINRLGDHMQLTEPIINRMISEFNNVTTVIIPRIEEQINIVAQHASCLESKSQYFRVLQQRLFNEIYMSIVSGVNALHQGKITPDFYPITKIRETLLRRADMKNSMYQEDVNLVYQLGNVIILQVSHEPFTVSCILVLPRLLREHVGVVLMINKVPITSSQSFDPVILQSPELVVKDVISKKVWTPNFDTCLRQTGTFYCPLHEIRTKYSLCLTSMLFGMNTTDCAFITAAGYPDIRQSTSGILISSKIDHFVEIVNDRDGNKKSIKREVPVPNSTNLLTIKHGMEIMLNHDIYLLSQETADITMQINENITYPDFSLNNLTLPDIPVIPTLPEYTPHRLYTGLHVSHAIIGAGIITVLIYLLYRTHMLKRKIDLLVLEYQYNRQPLMSRPKHVE
uniref:Glycoprotein n=1 Tax=Canya virus TaxID=2800909 RepID=A0A894KLD0_9VIRU|nr:MAG: glycoprotein [Canya virus]